MGKDGSTTKMKVVIRFSLDRACRRDRKSNVVTERCLLCRNVVCAEGGEQKWVSSARLRRAWTIWWACAERGEMNMGDRGSVKQRQGATGRLWLGRTRVCGHLAGGKSDVPSQKPDVAALQSRQDGPARAGRRACRRCLSWPTACPNKRFRARNGRAEEVHKVAGGSRSVDEGCRRAKG